MLFKTKNKEPQDDEISRPESKSGDASAVDVNPKDVKPAGNDDIVYPSGLKLALLMTSVFTGMFLVSLDRLIISTAIPQITNDFNSANDIGWYGTSYLLTSCAFQLVFGKIYTVFSIKTTFMVSILLFEVGSALCGAAPNSIAFIIGRSIAGLGSGGIMSGTLIVIVYAIPLQRRPKYQGFFGAVFGISSVIGPLVGGAFTTSVTWRWCFYLNLPIGGVVMLLIPFLLHVPERASTKLPLKDKLAQLNSLGLVALLPGVVCLCLALQWGGTTYPWSDGRIIALLVLAFVLLIAFVAIQAWKPDQATVPPHIFLQRSILSGFWVSACTGGHMMLFVYYLPLWFQAVDGVSAVQSGIRLLPMVMPLVLSSIANGQMVSYLGYYTPSMIFGICLTAIGAGLLNTLEINSSQALWVGAQFIFGFGMGFSVQGPNMAAQTVLPREEVAIGASLMLFSQQLFGAVFVSVGQNVLDNQFSNRLAGIPGVDPDTVQNTGATDVLKAIPARYRTMALKAYNSSLRVCFRVGLVLACIAIIGALGMEWRSVKAGEQPKRPDAARDAEEGKSHKELNEKEALQDEETSEPPAEESIKAEKEQLKDVDALTEKEAPRDEETSELPAEESTKAVKEQHNDIGI